MNYLTLPIGRHAPERVNAVVEIPRGQSNKYEYDAELQTFRLDRPLFSSVHYPGDYGFIPSTLSEDGDALDILVLVDSATFPGCLIEARPIGALEMLDQGVIDVKVLAVAESSPFYRDVTEYTDLPSHLVDALKHFFSVYKQLEGKKTEVKGLLQAQRVRELVARHHDAFERAHEEAAAALR